MLPRVRRRRFLAIELGERRPLVRACLAGVRRLPCVKLVPPLRSTKGSPVPLRRLASSSISCSNWFPPLPLFLPFAPSSFIPLFHFLLLSPAFTLSLLYLCHSPCSPFSLLSPPLYFHLLPIILIIMMTCNNCLSSTNTNITSHLFSRKVRRHRFRWDPPLPGTAPCTGQ